MKGIYVLIFLISSKKLIEVGKLGARLFRAGFYAYVGSAFSGIQRLNRHLNNIRRGKVDNPHWHIDCIVPHAEIVEWLFASCSCRKKEEELATTIAKDLSYIPGFGSSDTNAPSHLFFSGSLEMLKEEVEKKFKLLGLHSIHREDFSIK